MSRTSCLPSSSPSSWRPCRSPSTHPCLPPPGASSQMAGSWHLSELHAHHDIDGTAGVIHAPKLVLRVTAGGRPGNRNAEDPVRLEPTPNRLLSIRLVVAGRG